MQVYDNKRQSDYLWKQRTHYRLRKWESRFYWDSSCAAMKFATLLMSCSVYMSRTPFSNIPQWTQWSQRNWNTCTMVMYGETFYISLGNRVATFFGNNCQLLAICSFCGCFIVFIWLSLWCWGLDADLIISFLIYFSQNFIHIYFCVYVLLFHRYVFKYSLRLVLICLIFLFQILINWEGYDLWIRPSLIYFTYYSVNPFINNNLSRATSGLFFLAN